MPTTTAHVRGNLHLGTAPIERRFPRTWKYALNGKGGRRPDHWIWQIG